jgi:hypothetical protein
LRPKIAKDIGGFLKEHGEAFLEQNRMTFPDLEDNQPRPRK